jgi:hypothetical protein
VTDAGSFSVVFTASAQRGMNRRPLSVATALFEYLTGPVAENPHRLGKQLDAPLDNPWSTQRGESGLNLTRHHRGFTGVHPSGLPLACGPRVEQGPLGFSLGLRTPPSPATHARAGTGHGARDHAADTTIRRPSLAHNCPAGVGLVDPA